MHSNKARREHGQLGGKIAVVTGAGSGIGAAIAAELHEQGAIVVAFDIDEPSARETIEGLGASASGLAVRVDVADDASVRAGVADVVARFGRIDVLANNAGIYDARATALETSDELWGRIIAVNLTGQFQMARAVLPTMVEQGSGAIVSTASTCSVTAGGGGTAYTVSKHGVLGLTRALAHEYGPLGIRVNAVGSGAIATPMSAANTAPGSPGDLAVRATTARRWGEPAEIARVVAFLAGDGASFMYGSLVMADGGDTMA